MNDAQFVDGLDGTLDGTSQYTSDVVPLSGLDTQVRYTALPGSPTLRTLVTFTNPSASDITAQVVVATNFGSDSNTGFRATSSGDTSVSAADRWTVSSDNDTTPSDPVNLTVVAGPGSPIAPPSEVSDDAFDCSNTPGVRTTYPVTVPAGATRALLLFHELYATNDEGIAAATAFDTTPASSSPLVAGLDGETLANVVNWAFCSTEPAICDDGNACTADACGAAGGCDHPKIPRDASLLSAGCRLGDLQAGIEASTIPAKTRDALAAKLKAAAELVSQADGATGKARKRLLAKAGRNVKAVAGKLKSKAVRKAVDASTLAAFKSAAADLLTDLKTLKKG